MIARAHVIGAVFRRDYAAYFSSPVAYVFITVFVFLGAFATFMPEQFFLNNLANLDQLNFWFPYIALVIVPAVAMGLWASERHMGTDELLLTLPATDFEIVFGKYLAAVSIYLTALAFSLSHVVVLLFLGKPDMGLMLSTYLGYALLGATLVSVAMVGSLLSYSMTVGFILGAVFCGLLVVLDYVASRFGVYTEKVSVVAPFRELTSGVLSLQAVVAAVATAGVMIYLSLIILADRRRGGTGARKALSLFLALVAMIAIWLTRGLALWMVAGSAVVALILLSLQWYGSPAFQTTLRLASALVVAVSLSILAGRCSARADLTVERLSSLTGQTRKLISELDPERPVLIRAFVSRKVPPEVLQTRNTLLTLLREFEARSGGAILLDVKDTDPSTDEAREARDAYGIEAREVTTFGEGGLRSKGVFLGAVFTSGAEEVVVPYFHPGIPLEYELARSIRVVSRAKRKKLGVLNTDARVFGGFDFQSMRSAPEWLIVEELKKQYDVVEVSPDSDYPKDLDLLLAVMPSSMLQEQVERFGAYALEGKPVVIVDDPIPLFSQDLSLAPSQPKSGGRRTMFGGPPPQPKGNLAELMTKLGVRWPIDQVAWDAYNPHPRHSGAPVEILFVGPGSGSTQAFNQNEPATSGLQEVVLIFSGHIRPADLQGLTFTPLMKTGIDSGLSGVHEMLRRGPFGVGFQPPRRHIRTAEEYTLAALVKGEYTEGDEKEKKERKVNVAVFADADFISNQFFVFRQGTEQDLRFDNVALILNTIDVLAGDKSFVDLRKRRPRHRILKTVEDRKREFERRRADVEKEAEEAADKKLKEARETLNRSVQEIRDRKDLDPESKSLMAEQAQVLADRKYEVQAKIIQDEKERAIERAQEDMDRDIQALRNRIRILAIVFPPIPAFVLAAFLFWARYSRERRSTLGQ